FRRSESYIGVMIDDLVTRGITEPYRMFTSRAEYRLSLRADNADRRLTPVGIECGLVGAERRVAFEAKVGEIERLERLTRELVPAPSEVERFGIATNRDGVRRSVYDLLSLPDMTMARAAEAWPVLSGAIGDVAEQVEIDAKYAVYMKRQEAEIERVNREEDAVIPAELDFTAMAGLSNEIRHKLTSVRPGTLAQAGRIDGMTPAALTLILAHVKRADEAARASSGMLGL
ncbi:MAG: tRNA uridine-5-carboxymethylaminomethyl(34) synthesis enzyme MnmG, partial [Siculibacillus sp.]